MEAPKRSHNIEVSLDATPEQVWEAITNADEITSWFAPECKVTPGAGGSIYISWGEGMGGEAPIRIWEPGKRYGWVEGEGSENPKTVEFQIEAKEGGGSTTLRLVNSGFGADAKFDDEFNSVFGGWHTFLGMLQYKLSRFPGVPAKNVALLSMGSESQPAVLEKLLAATGITSTVEGSAYEATLGDFKLQGKILRTPKPGYYALSVNTVEDSLLGIFVEGSKKAMVTFEWVLFGETRRLEPQIRETIETFMSSLMSEKKEEEAKK